MQNITIYYVTTSDFFGTSESRPFFDAQEAKDWGEESTLEDVGEWTGDDKLSFTIEVVNIPISALDLEGVEVGDLETDDVFQYVDDWGEYVEDVQDIEVFPPNQNVDTIVDDVQLMVARHLDIRKRDGGLLTFWGGYLQLPGLQVRIKDHTCNPARLGANDISFVVSATNMGNFSGGDSMIFDPTDGADEIATKLIMELIDHIEYVLDDEDLDEFDQEELAEILENLKQNDEN